MGFFAISSRGSRTQFSVEACHLTLWVLPKHWYDPKTLKGFYYFFDIGIRIHSENELRRIRLACPFDSEGAHLRDLSTFVLDAEFAPLIFAHAVTVVGDRITYDASAIGQGVVSDRVIPISTVNSTAEEESDPRFSVWTIEFRDPIPAGESAYVRFRFQIEKPGVLWTSKGWGYAKRGMIVDLRVADVRESNFLGLGRAEADHVVPIKRLFLFLGAPSYFVPKHVSPPLHYSRLLEPDVWGPYLGDRRGWWTDIGAWLRLRTKISIHQWRSDGAASDTPIPVTLVRPYRAYMDVAREFGPSLLILYLLGVAIFPIATWIWEWLWSHVFSSWFGF